MRETISILGWPVIVISEKRNEMRNISPRFTELMVNVNGLATLFGGTYVYNHAVLVIFWSGFLGEFRMDYMKDGYMKEVSIIGSSLTCIY